MGRPLPEEKAAWSKANDLENDKKKKAVKRNKDPAAAAELRASQRATKAAAATLQGMPQQ